MPHLNANRPESKEDRVIVVGAGPVGLMLTLKLIQNGIPVTLIEKFTNPNSRTRCIAPAQITQLHSKCMPKSAFTNAWKIAAS